jgi:hypothetical protein
VILGGGIWRGNIILRGEGGDLEVGWVGLFEAMWRWYFEVGDGVWRLAGGR